MGRQCLFRPRQLTNGGFPTSPTFMSGNSVPMKMCLAWYRKEQWDRWREISDDRDEMPILYEDWLAKAESAVDDFTKRRTEVHKVVIGIEAFLTWIKDNPGTIASYTRSTFATEVFGKMWMGDAPQNAENFTQKTYKEFAQRAKGLDISEVWEPYLRRPKTAICPIFFDGDSGLEHFGSGVLVEIGNAHFLLSAAHVTERRHKHALFAPSKDGFTNIFGRFLETALPKSGSRHDDTIDVGCVRLDPKVVGNLHSDFQFLDATDCDLHDVTAPGDMYTVIGWPARKSKRDGASLYTEMFSLSGDGVMDFRFERLNRSPLTHLLVQHRFKRSTNFSNMLRTQPPHPEGMSGCGIFAWPKDLRDMKSLAQPKLVSILTEYHQEHNVFVGTRLSVHLNIIHRSDSSLPIVPQKHK